MTKDLALYIHWPFCLSKCPYCDFNSIVSNNIDHIIWQNAYKAELKYWAEKIGKRSVSSIYFGGGTPSLMSPALVDDIIKYAKQLFTFANNIEITLEANPTSTETNKLNEFKSVGINRISLGVQSLREKSLEFLGRTHNVLEAKKAIIETQKIFNRSSFDLIYALPNQNIKLWKDELREAVDLAHNHLSLYQLTIEENTPFKNQNIATQNEEESLKLYNVTTDILKEHKFIAYEVSNYAKKGEESQHNLAYWNYRDYLGIGAGAQSRITISDEKYAIKNISKPKKWLEKITLKKNGVLEKELLSSKEKCIETLMMGLRLKEGMPRFAFIEKTGVALEEIIPIDKLNMLINEGYIISNDSTLKATNKGRLCLNSILNFLF